MKKNTYAIDHDNKTITLTKKDAQQANIPGTKAFRELSALYKAFSDYTIVKRTAVITADKNVHKGLNIELIEKIIARQSNAEELLREYNELVAFWGREVNDKKNPGEKVIRAPYGKVKSWFLKKLPEYKNVDFSKYEVNDGASGEEEQK